ncbi:MAG: relaxase/mobilization nuclease domain-containing protein [Cellvibrionaceae bacterium]
MLLKGNQRGGGRQMALHLLNGMDNEHVSIHEVRGFIASDVLGALNEAYALSKGTKCKQFMYSLSLNPPREEKVGIETFEAAIEKIEKELGLDGQARVVVFHEKNGRRHAHCVWSRIDTEEMKAVNMSNDRRKLNSLSKSLYLEHGWKLPEGFLDKSKKNPLNFTREEWEQAKRIGRKASDIKRELQECWAISDTKKTFENALEERGYYLARGDRGGFVVIDIYGEIYPLNKKKIGKVKKEIAAKLGDPEKLDDIETVKKQINEKITALFKSYTNELYENHKKQIKPLKDEKTELKSKHEKQRQKLRVYIHKRWQREELERNKNIRKGFKGLWDKINGRYWKVRKFNEVQTRKCRVRDRDQLEELFFKQMAEKLELEARIDELSKAQEYERRTLIKHLSAMHNYDEQTIARIKTKEKEKRKERQNEFGFDGPDFDIEPEL